jgi:hypothetical protein
MSSFDPPLVSVADDDSPELVAPLVDEADLILPSSGGNFDPNSLLPTDYDPPDTIASSASEAEQGFPNADPLSPPKPALPRDRIPLPVALSSGRPLLRRDGSVPAPRQPPPPAPPGTIGLPLQPRLQLSPHQQLLLDNTAREQLQQQLQQQEQAARDGPITGEDSLTLLQLRRLLGADGPTGGMAVQTVPEPTPYAFTYADASSLPEEIEEWFSYGLEERARVAKCHASFVGRWTGWNGNTFGSGRDDWVKASQERRKEFVRDVLKGLGEGDVEKRVRDVETLVYIVLGVWEETSGLKAQENGSHTDLESEESEREHDHEQRADETTRLDDVYENFGSQIEWIRTNTELLIDCGGLPTILELVKSTSERAW